MSDIASVVAAGLDELPIQAAILDDEGVIRYTNRQWRQFGAENGFVGSPDTIGVDYLDVCEASEDPDATAAATGLRSILSGAKRTFSFEYPCHSPDEERWFLMRASAFDHGGESYVFVFHLAITDRVEAEVAAEERADRLEGLARLLAHDLRNPLSVALGYAEMVAADRPADDRAEKVLTSLVRMETLIDDALVLARDGRAEDRRPVDLETVAREAWAQVPTESATLRVVDDLCFDASPSLLANLLENLFRNAVVHGGREVVVRVGSVEDGFYVEDDGPGIPPDLRERIFEAGESTSHSGAGLGLAIVDTIAAAHGWTVRATESEPGGARFEVRGVAAGEEGEYG